MKDRFIEQDGLLFLKCEPEPLKKDTPMPCIAELIYDSSPMGIYNKARSSVQVCGMARGINKQYPQFEYLDWEHNEYMHWSRYNVVAKHCPEGSIEWALWQMINGKKVCNLANEGESYSCGKNVSSAAWFFDKNPKDGWYIPEEPKPVPLPEVGKWYRLELDKPYYYQCTRVNINVFDVRRAGDTYVMSLPNTLMKKFWETSLEPDFSNAKVGDECFDMIYGHCTITQVRTLWGVTVVNTGRGVGYIADGRESERNANPTLFHSSAQCAAYFAEVAPKREVGNEALQIGRNVNV